jgi:hypothetical protein
MNILKYFARQQPVSQTRQLYDNLLEEIKQLTYPFGSTVFGGATKYSDTDLLCSEDNYLDLKAVLIHNSIDYRVKTNNYSFSPSKVIFALNRRTYEVTLVEKSEIETYKKASHVLQIYAAYVCPITNRTERHKKFTALVSAYNVNGAPPKYYQPTLVRYAPELLI